MKLLLHIVLFLLPSLLWGQTLAIEAGLNTVYGLKSRESSPYSSDVTPRTGYQLSAELHQTRAGLIKQTLQLGFYVRSYAYRYSDGGINSFLSQSGEITETSMQLHWYIVELNPTHQLYLQAGIVAGGGLNVRNSYSRLTNGPGASLNEQVTENSGLTFSPQIGLSARTYYLFLCSDKGNGWYPKLQLDYVYTSLPELVKTSFLVASFGLGYRF